ncbi:adenine phosphoribosyltransferase [Mahella australiensis]|uniref:Adenine phosphoribosyltransferase n=1 Tax=Mahella australiensis (strain DSM 15567 / CIP 107919 / 50-1 BON) TaxID=697281 RepID=F4A280_MAHA5|nr:adenine phosphoribosyltransferase [Mahella australiensis]AEE96127.1 adenine phosphoribosyltransferase [Mahella australiensis 50-1 BON]
MDGLKEKVRIVPDFPKKGISFKDITTLLKDKEAYHYVIKELAAGLNDIDLVVGPEARGFVIGAPLAYELYAGFVLVRKPGKLPAATIKYEYELEYGTDALEIHRDAIIPGQRVVVADDLLATGGTAYSVVKLVQSLGAEVVAIRFVMELTDLAGRERLSEFKDCDIKSLIQFDY